VHYKGVYTYTNTISCFYQRTAYLNSFVLLRHLFLSVNNLSFTYYDTTFCRRFSQVAFFTAFCVIYTLLYLTYHSLPSICATNTTYAQQNDENERNERRLCKYNLLLLLLFLRSKPIFKRFIITISYKKNESLRYIFKCVATLQIKTIYWIKCFYSI